MSQADPLERPARANGGRRLKRAVQHLGRVTVNKLVVTMLRTGVRIPVVSPASVIALVTVGRRSGGRRVTPMGFVRIDETRLWVVSEHGRRADWYRNARAGPVGVYLGRRLLPCRVRLLPDEDPRQVLAGMPGRAVALVNRALWYKPEVVEITLETPPAIPPRKEGT